MMMTTLGFETTTTVFEISGTFLKVTNGNLKLQGIIYIATKVHSAVQVMDLIFFFFKQKKLKIFGTSELDVCPNSLTTRNSGR